MCSSSVTCSITIEISKNSVAAVAAQVLGLPISLTYYPIAAQIDINKCIV